MTGLLLSNALLLSLLAWWLRHAWRRAAPALRSWLLPALAWRLLFTAAAAALPSSDAQQASYGARGLAARLLAYPDQALAILGQARLYDLDGRSREFYKWSQTLFFDKLVALLSLATGGTLWVNACYLSLGCFVASWALVSALRRALPQAPPGAAQVAFLLWPTVLWWTSGLNKEAVIVGAGAGVVALVLPVLYPASGAKRLPWGRLAGQLLAALLLAWVLVRMRYFFALPLLGGLLALAGVRVASKRGWLGPGWRAQVGGLLLGLALLAGVAKLLGGRLMEIGYFTSEVTLNYQHGLSTSGGRPHLEYAHWQPTAAGLLARAPLAVVYTLTRPWLGEGRQLLYVGAGLENLLLTALVVLALVAAGRGRPGPLPVALVAMLLLYCLLLAAFIGLSTPNLGTLSRYRIVLLPWLLWLVLAANWRTGELLRQR